MTRFSEYDVVRVIKLLTPSRRNYGAAAVMRQPEVGDTGTIVNILHDAEDDSKYIVECVDGAGMTTWLCDFDHEELELQWRPRET